MNAFRTFTVGQLRRGAGRRLPGYIEECLRRGQIDPAHQIITDETPISFTMPDFRELRKNFNPKTGIQTLTPGCC
jgi:hypothetical protein